MAGKVPPIAAVAGNNNRKGKQKEISHCQTAGGPTPMSEVAGRMAVQVDRWITRVMLQCQQHVRARFAKPLQDTGYPEPIGQELVVPGELVDIDYEAVPDMPAAAPADTGDVSMPSDAPQAVRRPGNADTSA